MDHAREAQELVARLNFRSLDELYKPGSFTFIHWKGKYAEAPWPMFHQALFFRNKPMVKALKKRAEERLGPNAFDADYDDPTGISREFMMWGGVLLGRYCVLDGWHLIMFWNLKAKDQALYECVHEVVQNHPEIAKSPERAVIFSVDDGRFPTRTLLDFGFRPTGQAVERPQDAPQRPECDKIAPVIDGRPYPLGNMMGDLHMVRGDRLSRMAGQFCGQKDALKAQAVKAGCDSADQMIGHLHRAFRCPEDPKGLWQRGLSDGRAARKQWLRDVFRDPDRIDKEFRTQREIDAAWKELMGEGMSFRVFLGDSLDEWLAGRLNRA